MSVSHITMTDRKNNKLIRDLKSIPSPVFYIFAAVALFCGLFVYGFSAQGAVTSIFLILLVACAASDIQDGIVPDLILVAIAILSVVNILLNENLSTSNIMSHLVGTVIVSVPMLIVAILVKGAFGGGDIKLMAVAGFYLGAKAVIAGFFLGMFTSGMYVILMLVLHRKNLKSAVKLAPFLVYGLAIISLYVEQIINRLSIVAQMC